MSRLDGRLKRLERLATVNAKIVKPWKYWDRYTPEERAEMNGRVRWIRDERPKGNDSDLIQRQV